MGLSECWKCPLCKKELPWTEEKQIEEHDCYTWIKDQDLDEFLDEINYYEQRNP